MRKSTVAASYSDVPAATLPENRVEQLSEALNQLLSSPTSKALENLLEKAKKQDVGRDGAMRRRYSRWWCRS